MSNKMKVWPGPRIMVPMATDILLVGDIDLPAPNNPATGTPLADTKINYYNLFSQQIADPAPFQLVNRDSHLQVGAHVMWTLPYALRRSKQDKSSGDVNFPFAPNRWLITRLEYASLADGSAPNVISHVVVSDAISPSDYPPNPINSQYPEAAGPYPFSTIGKSMPLSEWTGEGGPETPFLKSAGPGALSWSVTYDNVRNVFGFYDDSLSQDANSGTPYYYTYYIVGWYASPENDALSSIPTSGDQANNVWQAALQNDFMWTLGESSSDLDNAIAAWTAWQQAHGLTGVFDPNQLDLPPQAKAAMVAWHAWQQANGEVAAQPDLAKQLLCHSMVATVKWEGNNVAYQSGVPLKPGEFPTIAVGNNSVEAISIYMANEIVNDPGKQQPVENIPIVARALEAFQQDLLYDYGKDPILVENLLHNTAFSKVSAGEEWIVVGEESASKDPVKAAIPAKSAGTQSIPLDDAQTDLLTHLNTLQSELNALKNTIATQRNELYLLDYKLGIISNNISIPVCVQTQVQQSYQALSAELQKNIDGQNTLQTTVAQISDQLTLALQPKDPATDPAYLLKSVVTGHFYAPNDPVIMIAGSRLDSKLSSAVVNMTSEMLDVRYTGQFVNGITVSYNISGAATPFTIGAAEILGKITFPAWNAFPKEVMDLWVETCILDTSAAALIAVVYFEKRNIPPSVYNAKTEKNNTRSPLQVLTATIQTNQTAIWNDANELEIPRHSLVEAAGMSGIPPAAAGVAFRNGQPWTPVFMDYSVKWFPTSPNSTDPFQQWELEELDYVWNGTSISNANAEMFFGRTVINPAVAQNIQLKIASFQNDPNYNNLPVFVQQDLQLAASLIPNLDIVTQSVNGFTERLITRAIAMSLNPEDNPQGNTKTLLNGQNDSFIPVLTENATNCACNNPGNPTPPQQYSPIRSGHFQLLNVWVVDSFGQIMRGVDLPINQPATDPITNVLWSESLTTPGDSWGNAYGQLPPRLSQGARASMNLLKSTDDSIISNSADATSPICGWVMPNHLDNSLMVFDADGNCYGSIIRIQSEKTSSNRSIRWDAAPGLNTALGAPPDILDKYLLGFVNGLLRTRFEGSDAFDDLMAAIDSALWTMSGYAGQNGNLSLLLGRPLAVVRAEVLLNLSGDPAYNQGWCDTGKFYNKNGTYQAVQPPFMSVPFSLRIGDAFLVENGVMGYFQDDNYDTFYPVYGVDGQTATIIDIIRAGNSLNFIPPATGEFKSSYVKSGHLVPLTSDGTPVKLTILVDPVGNIPIFPGSLPYSTQSLPNGPVSNAMKNLQASFRAGPLLLDPRSIKMPTPAEIQGKWDWVARRDVSNWNEEMPIATYSQVAALSTDPLRLIEGWLNLSEFESKNNQ